MKEERSAFGKLLHEIFLDPKPKILQEQLAKEMGISASAISYMVNEETLGYDQTAYNNLYNMLKSLAKLGRSISEDQVRRLFEAIEKHPLSKSSQDALIARLKQELIIKQAYLTIWQTPLIGRERDIQAVLSKLRDEKIRFLTLVGLPGVGKTELARQIKKLTQENFTPMDFPALQEKTSAAEVLRQISEKLRDTDRQKRTLLILNNCELITDINEARVALYNLLDDNEQLIILATSRRARFSVKDEYEVLPLEVPRSVNESPEGG